MVSMHSLTSSKNSGDILSILSTLAEKRVTVTVLKVNPTVKTVKNTVIGYPNRSFGK